MGQVRNFSPLAELYLKFFDEGNMSFEKRKEDEFLTIKIKQDILLYQTEPDTLDPIKYATIQKLIGSTWKDYKNYKGI
jgi:hypothetical protein